MSILSFIDGGERVVLKETLRIQKGRGEQYN